MGISDREKIKDVLGITIEMSEEFWESQERAARHRFFWMLLTEAGHQIRTDYNLAAADISDLIERGKVFLEKGNTYEQVRKWFKLTGEFLSDKAFKHNHVISRSLLKRKS